ncbi:MULTISPECIES: hypothetical protein [unclassified Streptomyces]|uniref:hypothetical protein n=2 Tax=Streptomyces TaxID=1883 RepID=UPI002B1CD1B9|nr:MULTISPECIES: hypothetical protein [unclassified Streptomyces]
MLEMVGVSEDQDHVVGVVLQEALRAGGERFAAPGGGERVAPGLGEAAVQDGGVQVPSGQGHGHGGELERLPR